MLSTTANYAIRAVGYLASLKPGGKADSTEIAEATGVPRRFLMKILTSLKFHRILNSARGIGGGFWLARGPGAITLYEVAVVFEDLPRLETCPLGADVCSQQPACPLHENWKEVRDAYFNFLKNKTFEAFQGVSFTGRFSGQAGIIGPPSGPE